MNVNFLQACLILMSISIVPSQALASAHVFQCIGHTLGTVHFSMDGDRISACFHWFHASCWIQCVLVKNEQKICQSTLEWTVKPLEVLRRWSTSERIWSTEMDKRQ